MSKPTKIVNVVQRRTAKEIDLSIEMLKRKILNLNVGAYRLSHVTPNSIPDIDVNVLETKVIAKFLCDKRYEENLINTLGSRALEYIESSLQDTYDYLQNRKQETEKLALDVITKITSKVNDTLNKDVMTKSKEVQNQDEIKELFPKHKLKGGDEQVIFAGYGKEDGSMIRVTMKLKNKADSVNFISFMMLRLEEQKGKKNKSKYVTVDSLVGDINGNTEGTLQFVIPNDIVVKVKPFGDGIRLKILSIVEEPKKS